MTLPATLSTDREPIDFDISVIFRCLDVQSVLLVLTAILTQQRIVFTSFSCPLLTLVTKVSCRLLPATVTLGFCCPYGLGLFHFQPNVIQGDKTWV